MYIYCAEEWALSKIKKIDRKKQKESQLIIFYFCLYSLSQVFHDINDNKWVKSLSFLSLCTNLVQNCNCYIKKNIGCAYIRVWKGTHHSFSDMFPKNKQNIFKKSKKDKIKQKSC